MTSNRFASVALTVLFLGLAGTAGAQIDPMGSLAGEGSGSYQDENSKAAKAYRQGLKFRKRAESVTDPAEREALYKKALDKFYESAGHVENFDARLAMGEVYLALDDKHEAAKACSIAKLLKPKNEKALACFTAAGGEAG
jgi:hypothetical protein